jgi:hypothetical protein
LRSLPLGMAYAVWTGIGVIGTAAIGIHLFGESTAMLRLHRARRRRHRGIAADGVSCRA